MYELVTTRLVMRANKVAHFYVAFRITHLSPQVHHGKDFIILFVAVSLQNVMSERKALFRQDYVAL